MIDLLPNRDKDACVIHNPVDPHKIRTQALESAPLPQRPFIVHVGKFKTEKRHDLLLQAFAQSSYTGDLVLVGQGPLQAELEALCIELQISDRVHFWGFHPNPFPIIKASELLVLCSDYEGMPMVLLEALSLNTPVLSTDCPGGPRDALLARQLVQNNDIAALATALSVGDFSIYRADLSNKFLLSQVLNRYEGLAIGQSRKIVGQRDRLANTYDALTTSE